MIIARPIAASAAATANIKNTKIWPFISPRKEENATKDKFIELSISSIDIKMIIAFLLTSTPETPIQKSIVLNIKI
jgi:hypothetical protein